MRLKIGVISIKGHCPVYKEGDEFYIEEGYKLNSKITLCMHSLSSIMPYYIPLSHGVSPQELGVSKPETKTTFMAGIKGVPNEARKAYIQCLDPVDYTHGGTVTFEITPEKGP